MTTKEKADLDFLLLNGKEASFIQCNFRDPEGTPRALNVVFQEEKFWEQVRNNSFTTDWSFFDRPIVARWKAKGKKPVDPREAPCNNCDRGELLPVGFTQPNGQQKFECNYCGHTISFP